MELEIIVLCRSYFRLDSEVVVLVVLMIGSKKQEARSKKQEARSKKQEAGSMKHEARSRKQRIRM